MQKKHASGFTLVELAIVLMIIGLLIGGILRGQEMMVNARLQNVMKQVSSFSAAAVVFRDTYAAYPGDLATAQARIPGCTAANSCQNGNGNGVMGNLLEVWRQGDQTIQSENAQFWKHLALTHLISGVRPNANASAFGTSHPTTPLGSGWSVATSLRDPLDNTGSPLDGAVVLRMHSDLTSAVIEIPPTISPKHAEYIDRKMDDGMPGTGDVQSSGWVPTGCEVAYDPTIDEKRCTMAFLLNR